MKVLRGFTSASFDCHTTFVSEQISKPCDQTNDEFNSICRAVALIEITTKMFMNSEIK